MHREKVEWLGTPHEAVYLTWESVEEILGRPHEGSAEDDEAIQRRLISEGAPGWVAHPEDGWVDEEGWGLIGPALLEDGEE